MRLSSRSWALILAAGWVVAAACGHRSTAAQDPGAQRTGQGGPATPSTAGGSGAAAMPEMPGMAGMPGMEGAGAARVAGAADGAMAHEQLEMGLHMRMTAPRPRTAGDQRRADAIVQTLRGAMARYRDYHAAVADGFIQFLPNVRQPMYHFTNYRRALKASFGFDPAQPTSLLYKPAPGGFDLVGVMYTAPRRFDEDQLDERVPLSVAAWHQHVNLCMPPWFGYAKADWHRFGLSGTIATASECRANGGIFHPVVLGWMVHVYPFEQDPAKIWAH